MRRLLVPLLVACGCAQVQPGGPHDGDVSSDLSVADAAADDLARAQRDLEPPPDLAGCLGRVKVNEVSTAGATSATDEYIELFNPCATAIDLTGSLLVYRSATNATANDSSVIAKLSGSIAPNGYFLVANSSYSGGATPDLMPFSVATGRLSPTGGAVGLRDPLGALVDSVGWGTANNQFVEAASAVAPAGGNSIGRQPNGHDSDDNRTDFAEGPRTPRAIN